jgi:hypothetical protein
MTITIGGLVKCGLLAATMALALPAAGAHAADSNDARIAQGLKIAPVPLNLNGLNRNQVGLGSYLVSAIGGCNGCHTSPEYATGGNPFNGDPTTKIVRTAYLAGGVNFGGTLCSSNITPDKDGLPDGLTFTHFVYALRTGHDFREKPKDLLEVMPWPTFRNMTNSDLAAIYEYLRAIPSNTTPTCP